jgi:hypothetical protein
MKVVEREEGGLRTIETPVIEFLHVTTSIIETFASRKEVKRSNLAADAYSDDTLKGYYKKN